MVDACRLPRVVIVGAGFGGLEAAKAMRDLAVDITIVDRQNYHCFQPLLTRWRLPRFRPQMWPGRYGTCSHASATRRC